MKITSFNPARFAPSDASATAGHLKETWAASVKGERGAITPRPVIGQSWQRAKRFGINPEQGTGSILLPTDELEHRRTSTALADVMPTLHGGLGAVADASRQIMVVTDPEGRVLWREGNPGVLRRADAICLEEGAAWGEDATGTNAIGTALSSGAPVQVHSAEHFVRALHDWTCAAAPVHDPRDGRIARDHRRERPGQHLPSGHARAGRLRVQTGRKRTARQASDVHRAAARGGRPAAVAGWTARRSWWTPTAGSPPSPGCLPWTGYRCPTPSARA